MNTILSAISFPVFTFIFVSLDLILLYVYANTRKGLNPFNHAIYLIAIFFMFPMLIATKYCMDTPGIPEGVMTLVYVLLAISGVAFLVPLIWNFVLKWKNGDVPSGTKRAFLIYITFFGIMFLISLIITLLEK